MKKILLCAILVLLITIPDPANASLNREKEKWDEYQRHRQFLVTPEKIKDTASVVDDNTLDNALINESVERMFSGQTGKASTGKEGCWLLNYYCVFYCLFTLDTQIYKG